MDPFAMNTSSSSAVSTSRSEASDTESSSISANSEKRKNSRVKIGPLETPTMSTSSYKASARQNGPMTCSGNVSVINEIDFGDDVPLVVRLTPDDQYWAVGLGRGSIKFFPAFGDSSMATYNLTDERECLGCTDLCFPVSPANARTERKHMAIAVYASGVIRFWHYTGATVTSRLLSSIQEDRELRINEKLAPKDNRNQILACSVSFDGRRLVTGGEDSIVRVYDVLNRCLMRVCRSSHTSERMDGHVSRICSLQYHPRGGDSRYTDCEKYQHIFISGGWDDSVQIWDDRFDHSLWQYMGPHISGSDAIDIDPIQNHIVTGSWRRDKAILQIWMFNEYVLADMTEMPKDKRSILRYEKPLSELLQDAVSLPTMGYVARWLGDQFVIYAGSNSNMVKVIDRGTLNTVGAVSDLPNGVYSLASYVPKPHEKKPYRLAFCAGTKVIILKMDRK